MQSPWHRAGQLLVGSCTLLADQDEKSEYWLEVTQRPASQVTSNGLSFSVS
jgi:hypothetical protein